MEKFQPGLVRLRREKPCGLELRGIKRQAVLRWRGAKFKAIAVNFARIVLSVFKK